MGRHALQDAPTARIEVTKIAPARRPDVEPVESATERTSAMDRLAERVPDRLAAMNGGDGRPWVVIGATAAVVGVLILLGMIISATAGSGPYMAHSQTDAVEHWCHNVAAIEAPIYIGDNGSDEYVVAWSDTSGHTFGALVQGASHTAAAKYQGTYTVSCTYTQVN